MYKFYRINNTRYDNTNIQNDDNWCECNISQSFWIGCTFIEWTRTKPNEDSQIRWQRFHFSIVSRALQNSWKEMNNRRDELSKLTFKNIWLLNELFNLFMLWSCWKMKMKLLRKEKLTKNGESDVYNGYSVEMLLHLTPSSALWFQ